MKYFLFFVMACQSTNYQSIDASSNVMVQEVENLIAQGRYSTALKKVEELKRSGLDNSYRADLLKGDIYFYQDMYKEALEEYILFYNLHPTYKDIDYVLAQIITAIDKKLPSTVDRDLSRCEDLILYANKLIRWDGKYKDKAVQLIDKCTQMAKDKNLYIANFYYRSKKYASAYQRYLEIVEGGDRSWLARLVDSAIKSDHCADLLQRESLQNYAKELSPCQGVSHER